MFMNVLAATVYLAVGVSSTLLIKGIAGVRSGSGGRVHDLMEAAFLNGGPARAADTALAAMQADGRLAVGGPGIVSVLRPVAHDPVERAVIHEAGAAQNGSLHTLRFAVMCNPAVQEIGDGLAARGLMIPPGTGRTWRTWGIVQAVTSFLMLPVAVVLTVVDYAGHHAAADLPFPFILKVLPACLTGLVIGIVCLSAANGRVTAAGRRAAGEFRAAHLYAADAGHRVALHGLRGLDDPVFRGQLTSAAVLVRTARARHVTRTGGTGSTDSAAAYVAAGAVVWCAASGHGTGGSGGAGCGGASGSSCGSSGGGSGCGGGSGGGCGSGGGSGCGGGSSSSCGSSSGSSCGGGGSSCGGGSSG